MQFRTLTVYTLRCQNCEHFDEDNEYEDMRSAYEGAEEHIQQLNGPKEEYINLRHTVEITERKLIRWKDY